MYRKIEDVLNDLKMESESTLKVFNNLTDESLKQKVTGDGRSLGFLAWHITTSLGEMMNRTGLSVPAPSEDAEPSSAKEIAGTYAQVSEALQEQIKSSWNDDTLQVEDNMYGEMWKRGMTLGALVMHQTHHRGQMTVVMRQAGLKVPGVYGPAKEEWAQFGMPEAK